jgi:RNA polymerase sigma-70 factor (ECF subfamily)
MKSTLPGCTRSQRHWAAAEDVVQDVFTSLAAADKGNLRISNLKGYLLAAVTNRARNLIKSRRYEPESLAEHDVPACQDECLAALVRDEQQRELLAAISKLPYEQQEVILLHLNGGLTFKVIAGHIDESQNTVQSWYRYGLEKLRSILATEDTERNELNLKKEKSGEVSE